MKQIYPATITGKSFAPGGSVLDHNFGKGDPYTLGVEEESTSSSTSRRFSPRRKGTSSRRRSTPS
jgi:hypothetical protein